MPLLDFVSLVRDLLADRQMSAKALAQEIPVDAGHLSRSSDWAGLMSPGSRP